ncbi:MAG: prolipoprotein diacylglyceryl transferase [Chloroflexota bacterium]|nr:prolipoprotein diacylglyceryl transferase [Chloroflexota bacterium]MBI5702811.1 prolipoprotein diacylglyceryl transferase [Chloroflexota bacterium]
MIEAFRSLFAPPRHFILLVAALWVGLTLAEKRSERHGVSKEQLNNLTFYSLIAYVIGGRLLFALSNFSAFSQSPLSVFSPNPDLFDPTGGLAAAILVGLIYGQRQKLQLWGTLDALTPIFAMLAIGLHLAHLAAGTAFGNPTTLPWSIDLWNAARHPTQIYELLASLLIFGWLWSQKAESPPGLLFLTFAALTAGARLFLEAFRGDSTLIFGGLRLAQITAWAALTVILFASESLRQRGEAQ